MPDFSPSGDKLRFQTSMAGNDIVYDLKKKTFQPDSYYDLAKKRLVRFSPRFDNIRDIAKKDGEWLVVDRIKGKPRRVSVGKDKRWRTLFRFRPKKSRLAHIDWVGPDHVGVMPIIDPSQPSLLLIIDKKSGKVARRLHVEGPFDASPDGRKLLNVLPTGEDGGGHYIVTDVITGKSRTIMASAYTMSAWLPDSRHILLLQKRFWSDKGGRLLLVDINGRVEATLATGVTAFGYWPN